eukprot:scaffold24872_cov51-Isochrysis_galbana.AAC.1
MLSVTALCFRPSSVNSLSSPSAAEASPAAAWAAMAREKGRVDRGRPVERRSPRRSMAAWAWAESAAAEMAAV